MTIDYPAVRRDDTSSVLHGVTVADPYRYLEDPDSDRTQEFVAAQNALSQPYLADLPARKALLDMTTALLTAPRRGVPWERGGRYFVIANPGELDQDQLYTAGSLDELLDVADPARRPEHVVHRRHGRDDGGPGQPRRQLPGLRAGRGRIRLAHHPCAGHRDSHRGERRTGLDEMGRSHLVARRVRVPLLALPGAGGSEFTEAMDAGELMLHRLVEPVSADEVVWARPADREWMAEPWVAADGRWLVLTTSPGTDSRSTIEAYRLVADEDGICQVDDDPVVVVGELTDAHQVVASVGDTLFLRTERDAPRGRLVSVDLAAPASPGRRSSASTRIDVLVDASARGRGLSRCCGRRTRRTGSKSSAHRGPPRLARTASADLGDRTELPSVEQRDLPWRHFFHPPGPKLPDRCWRAGDGRCPLPAYGPEIDLPDVVSGPCWLQPG